MKTKYILICFLAIFMICSIGYLYLPSSGLDKAPDISLQLINGKKLDLSDLKGKPVLLTFWATSCPGCMREMPHLIDLYEELNPKGLEIIAIAMPYDRPDYVVEMVQHKKLPYLVALDIKADAVRAFNNVALTPTTFLIDHQGNIVRKKTGEMNLPVWHKQIEFILNKMTRS